MEVAAATEMKNPEKARVGRVAMTLWILRGVYPRAKRRAQNDTPNFQYSICETLRELG